MRKLRWGILATGRIAQTFAKGIAASKTGKLVAVGSRSLESAQAFCAERGGTPLSSYRAVAEHPDVDVVYIATPHHTHEDDTSMCAKNGKHILCEKPFTLSLESAERAIAEVRRNKVFFAEAFMYRFLPQTEAIVELLRGGLLGEIHHVRSEFGYQTSRDTQNFRFERKLGGGALMDVGVYCVSMSRLLLGQEPVRCEYAMEPSDRGYDAVGTGFLVFEGGKSASFSTGVHLEMKNRVHVYGVNGSMEIESPWMGNSVATVRLQGCEPTIHGPWPREDLYAYEIDAVHRSLSELEAPEMTIADTLGQARALDMLKSSAGLTFN